MAEFLNKIIPNVMARTDIFWESFRDTFIMVGWAGGISFLIGIILGITLIVTRPSGIVPNKVIYQVIDKIVNFFRSIPFIILLVGLVPLSRAIMGTGIGVKGAIVPLIFGCAPFFTRQMETAMSDVNPGLIEAAQSMGAGTFTIIFRVLLVEARTSILVGATIAIGTILGYSAMAGTVGGGGLGDIAIRYGYHRYQVDIMVVTVVLLIVLVQIFQTIGMHISNKIDRRKR